MPEDKARIAPPQTFRAQKRGYLYEVAALRPDREDQWERFMRTANARLENTALFDHEKNKYMPLWIHEVTTGYRMIGSKSQGPSTTAYYPAGIAHDDIIIRGVAPTQYMYDRLVEFVTVHHQFALDANRNFSGAFLGNNPGGGNGTLPLKFSLYNKQPEDQRGYHRHKSLQYSVYIPTITAGAMRFQNAREYEIQMLVVNNYRETQTYTVEFNRLFSQYKNSIFNPIQRADPRNNPPAPRSNGVGTGPVRLP